MRQINAHRLRHPLYLDVPMMVSFLAAIEDGIAYDVSVARRTGHKGKGAAEAEGKVGLPSLLGLLPFDLRGRLSGEFEGTDSEELKLVKRHTEASLFNKLRNELLEAQAVKSLDSDFRPEDLAVGDLVEIAGLVGRNPLAEILALFNRMFPMLEAQPRPQAPGTRRAKQPTGSPATPKPEEIGIKVVQWVSEDLANARTEDALLRIGSAQPIILTLNRDFGTGATLDDLLGTRLLVLAKVSEVVAKDADVNLLRRSVLGYMTEVDQILDSFENIKELNLDLSAGKVSGPTIQLLPLAMFV